MKMFELLGLFIRPSGNLVVGAFKLSKSDKRSVFDVTERNNTQFLLMKLLYLKIYYHLLN